MLEESVLEAGRLGVERQIGGFKPEQLTRSVVELNPEDIINRQVSQLKLARRTVGESRGRPRPRKQIEPTDPDKGKGIFVHKESFPQSQNLGFQEKTLNLLGKILDVDSLVIRASSDRGVGQDVKSDTEISHGEKRVNIDFSAEKLLEPSKQESSKYAEHINNNIRNLLWKIGVVEPFKNILNANITGTPILDAVAKTVIAGAGLFPVVGILTSALSPEYASMVIQSIVSQRFGIEGFLLPPQYGSAALIGLCFFVPEFANWMQKKNPLNLRPVLFHRWLAAEVITSIFPLAKGKQ